MEITTASLVNLLRDIYLNSDSDFSGLGLIVCEDTKSLPVFPLRQNSDFFKSSKSLEITLLEISSFLSEYHDGFHVISPNGNIKMISQYFSPPIDKTVVVSYSKSFGGRYLAALFGSTIPSVVLTGVVSRGFGLAVFRNGTEIYFEKLQ